MGLNYRKRSLKEAHEKKQNLETLTAENTALKERVTAVEEQNAAQKSATDELILSVLEG